MGLEVSGAVLNLNHTAHYVHWHFFQMSVPNLLVIAGMVVIFFAAILLPFPGGGRREESRGEAHR